jgi:putative oxidoreductase
MNSSSPVLIASANADSTARSKAYFAFRLIDFIVAAIFIYAGAIKAWDPIGFANDIDNYKILPWAIGVRLAFYLPWLEILCGLALITRRLYVGGLAILTTLVFIFMVATIAAKVRGLDITCGCFGHASKNLSFTWHLALDLVLLAALLVVYVRVASGNGLSLKKNPYDQKT